MKACDPSTHFMWTGRTVPPRSTSLSPQPLHRIDFIWRLNTHLSSVPCRADDAGPRRDGIGHLCADGRTDGRTEWKFKREQLRPSARHYFLKCWWKQNVFNVYVRDIWDIWMSIWQQRYALLIDASTPFSTEAQPCIWISEKNEPIQHTAALVLHSKWKIDKKKTQEWYVAISRVTLCLFC